jgi:hypothetical protein
MRITCIFGFHQWRSRNCARCGKGRSESAHEAATRRAIRKAAEKGRVDEVRALLTDVNYLMTNENGISGKFGSTHLDRDAQQLVESVATDLACARQQYALRKAIEEAVKNAKSLAVADSFAKLMRQPSQPRDAGAMLASRPKAFRRW